MKSTNINDPRQQIATLTKLVIANGNKIASQRQQLIDMHKMAAALNNELTAFKRLKELEEKFKELEIDELKIDELTECYYYCLDDNDCKTAAEIEEYIKLSPDFTKTKWINAKDNEQIARIPY